MKTWGLAFLQASVFLSSLPMLGAGVALAADAPADACIPDRAALLALDGQAFDQDLNGGWRHIAYKPGCMTAAADLLRDYRAAHPQEPARILYWHEGQLRAMTGDTAAALPLLDQSRDPRATSRAQAWNAYVDATMAFLRRDQRSLLAARDRLSHVPPPPPEPDARGTSMKVVKWPMNMGIVNSLVACFTKPYADAYDGTCDKPRAPPHP
ncbi:hypothetical protein UCD39_18365 [Nitrospirillum sp. BR 11752]|uniref:hypothetical protein n=1 Tax=Nitrospirillum sp. BR 11752 TaxID=3104293 RepID=UPI002EAEA424|nr:hypothetical protein [Nitrospirillum sp. BR 11752]